MPTLAERAFPARPNPMAVAATSAAGADVIPPAVLLRHPDRGTGAWLGARTSLAWQNVRTYEQETGLCCRATRLSGALSTKDSKSTESGAAQSCLWPHERCAVKQEHALAVRHDLWFSWNSCVLLDSRACTGSGFHSPIGS